MARRRFVVTLPSEPYQRLSALAADKERDVEQQASFLLRRLLDVAPHSIAVLEGSELGNSEPSAVLEVARGGTH